jgi:hypothetical protein
MCGFDSDKYAVTVIKVYVFPWVGREHLYSANRQSSFFGVLGHLGSVHAVEETVSFTSYEGIRSGLEVARDLRH